MCVLVSLPEQVKQNQKMIRFVYSVKYILMHWWKRREYTFHLVSLGFFSMNAIHI